MGVKFSRIIRYKIKHVLNSNKTIYSFGRGTNDSWPYGRRLHENTHYPYILPHDLNEVDRLDTQHYAIKHTIGRLYHAPLAQPRRAIDIGTGTGVWLMEMAVDFPECEFIGIDIAAIQPTTVLPSNCSFKFANVLEGLPYPDGYFDYVHHRLLALAIPNDRWTSYMEECVRLCAPGGWIEMVESDIIVYGGGPAFHQINDYITQAASLQGIELAAIEQIGKLMEEAGLVDILVDERHLPLSLQSGTVDKLFWNNYVNSLRSMSPFLIDKLNLTQEHIDQLIIEASQETLQYRTFTRIFIFVGRKC